MKKSKLLLVFCLLVILQIYTSANAQYTNLHNFAGNPDGGAPYCSLISDGTFLYGTTNEGGTSNLGTLFKIMPDGSGYIKLLDFDSTNGSHPLGDLISVGAFLYGMTYNGGVNDLGTIFKIMPDGSGYVKLLDFAGATNGSSPWSTLITDGTFLYGMTAGGGTNDMGTIFKIMPDGSGYVKLLDFAGTTNGRSPTGELISDGTFLYGMTVTGGTNDLGTLFKIMPDGSGYIKLLDFVGANGSNPYRSLISDGTFLYGTTYYGGINGNGIIFKIMPDGSGYVKLLDFGGASNGVLPQGSLISDGTFLYGTTSEGGTIGLGTLFKIMPDGSGYVKLLDFAGPANGSTPRGSLISDGTLLYGMTWVGGTNGWGTIFKYCIPLTVAASNTGPYCEGATIQLNASGDTTYSWSGPLSYSSGSQNPTITSSTIGMSGVYTVTVTNSAGCSTNSTTNVTVNSLPDATLSLVDITIIANQSGANYQWVDCNNSSAILAGETNQNYTPTVNGSYAVIVELNGCSDTSICQVISNVGISEIVTKNSFVLYPNPANNYLQLKAKSFNGNISSIDCIDINGRIVKVYSSLNIVDGIVLDVSTLHNGIYFLRLNTNEGVINTKFIKN